MALTPEQIAMANARSATQAEGSPDGRVNTAPAPVKPVAPASKPIETIADLPPATDDTTAPSDNVIPVDDGKPADDTTVAPTDDKVIDFNDFLKAGATDQTPLEDKTKVVDDKSTSTVKPLKATPDSTNEATVTDSNTDIQPKTAKERIAKDLATRDVTDLPADIAPFFKENMSRPAFDKIKPIILEHGNLKKQNAEMQQKIQQMSSGAPPDSYYEHPEAFVLTPEYTQQAQNVNVANHLVNHWQEQFQAVRDGALEYTTVDFDNNGKLVYNKVKADKNAELDIMKALNFTQNQLMQQQAGLQSIGAVHKEKYKSAIAWAKQHEQTIFSIFDKPEQKHLLQGVAQIVQSFHPSFRNNPLAVHLAKAEMLMMHMGNYIKALEEKTSGGKGGKTNGATNGSTNTTAPVRSTREQTLAQRQRMAGPTSTNTGSDGTSGTSNGSKEVSLDDFNRVKEGY